VGRTGGGLVAELAGERDARGHLDFGSGNGIGEGDVVAIAFGGVEVSQGRVEDNRRWSGCHGDEGTLRAE